MVDGETAKALASGAGAVCSIIALGVNVWLTRRNWARDAKKAKQQFLAAEFVSTVRTPITTILEDVEQIVTDLRGLVLGKQKSAGRVTSGLREIQKDQINPLFERLLTAAARAESHPHLPDTAWSDVVQIKQDAVLTAIDEGVRHINDVGAAMRSVDAVAELLTAMDRDLRSRLAQVNADVVGYVPEASR